MGTRNLNEKSITKAVITRMKKAESARFKTVITSLVKNLHRFAREVELTEVEWNYGIDFLTRTFRLRTIRPKYYPVPTDGPTGELLKAAARHPMRPAHIHFMVNAKGYDRLVTHVFVKGDKYIDSDAVFGVRDSLISKFRMHKPGKAPDGTVLKTPYCTLHYDFVMRPAKKPAAARKH